MTTLTAQVRRIEPPTVQLAPPAAAWQAVEALPISHFRPEGADHRPQTTLQLVHDDRAIYGLFRVQDRYVRCQHDSYGAPVYRDSCVEFFVQPRHDRGYFNWEFNCGGAFLCCYITDATRLPNGGFKEFIKLSAAEVKSVRVATSLPKLVEPERVEPVDWWLAFAMPVSVLEPYTGPLGDLAGQSWRGNAYKCGNATSHPHWAAWAPVDELNFHLPRCFGELLFD